MLNAVLQLPECRLILDMLYTQLPPYVQYHTVHHTLDVCSRAEALALQEGIPAAEMQLLLIATVYHDAGYLQSYENHEELSCGLAKELLPQFNYSTTDVETICNIILATRIPQRPDTHLEQIICDADLDYLGRDDFFAISQILYQEMRHKGIVKNEAEWDNLQISFIENHHYFTATAIEQRQAQQEKHLSILKQKFVKL